MEKKNIFDSVYCFKKVINNTLSQDDFKKLKTFK